ATQVSDVISDPAQGGDLVERAEVARAHGVANVEEALDAEAAAHRHADHAVPSEAGAVVEILGAGPDLEAAAVEPDEHGRRSGRIRGPDVEVQVIRALRVPRLEHTIEGWGHRQLGSDVPGSGGVEDAGPA